MSEWLIYHQVGIFVSPLSWWEQVTIWWDDDVYFTLDQHSWDDDVFTLDQHSWDDDVFTLDQHSWVDDVCFALDQHSWVEFL